MNLSTHSPSFRRRAFTLVEILTALAITTIIVIALVSMFNASTKALQVANRQTDIWESARATFGILKRELGEVSAGGDPARVNLFAANGPARIILKGEPMRLQDIYFLTRDNNQWTANVFLLGADRLSDDPDAAVATLYHYRKNYPVVTAYGDDQLDMDLAISALRHPLGQARDALEKQLDDVANGRPINPTNSVNVMAKGIIHLRLVAYAQDGRAFAPTNTSNMEIYDELGPGFVSRMYFSEDKLPASLDLEMFVLEPDRIEEFRSQGGPIARQLYLEKHENSIQLFRTRIPIRRDLLARQ
jgi:type II secretory pathway component PulJ